MINLEFQEKSDIDLEDFLKFTATILSQAETLSEPPATY